MLLAAKTRTAWPGPSPIHSPSLTLMASAIKNPRRCLRVMAGAIKNPRRFLRVMARAIKNPQTRLLADGRAIKNHPRFGGDEVLGLSLARATGCRPSRPLPWGRGELSQVAQVGDQVVDVVFLQNVERRHPTLSLLRQRREALRLIQDRRFDQYRTTPRALGVRALAGCAIFGVGGPSRPLVAAN